MRAHTHFILLLAAVNLLSFSAQATATSSCATALMEHNYSAKTLTDLAQLKTEIKNEKDPVLATTLRREYLKKLQEARRLQIDLSKLNTYANEAHKVRSEENRRENKNQRAAETAEHDVFKWPNVTAQLPQGEYRGRSRLSLNRFVGTDMRVGNSESTMIVWDMHEGKTLSVFPAQIPTTDGEEGISDVSVSPDAKRALLVVDFSSTILYDLSKNKNIFEFDQSSQAQFSRDGSKAIIDTENEVQVWDLSKPTPEKILGTKEKGASHLSADGTQLIILRMSDYSPVGVDVWDLATRSRVKRLDLPIEKGSSDWVWSEDSRYLSLRVDKKNEIYDVFAEKLVHTFEDTGLLRFKFSPDASLILTEHLTLQNFTVLENGSWQEKFDIKVGEDAHTSFSPDSRLLVIATKSKYTIYDSHTGKVFRQQDVTDLVSANLVMIKGHLHLVTRYLNGLAKAEKIE